MERKKSFKLDTEAFFGAQWVLRRRGVPFYEAWDEITSDMENYYGNNFLHLVFYQGIASVLSGPAETWCSLQNDHRFFSDLKSTYNSLLLDTLEQNGCTKNELEHFNYLFNESGTVLRLPVRLPDKMILQAAQEGNFSKLVLLYDMAANKGEKLKNIYHSLLNDGYFELAMKLHERYGGLEKISRHALEFSFLSAKGEENKSLFRKFCCEILDKNDPYFWCKCCQCRVLDKVLLPALESGFSPDGLVINTSKRKVPLRKLLYLMNELEDSFPNGFPGDRNKRYWENIVSAAQQFSHWEMKMKKEKEND